MIRFALNNNVWSSGAINHWQMIVNQGGDVLYITFGMLIYLDPSGVVVGVNKKR